MSARRFSANLSYNIFGALLPLATSLATVPLYIHQIGLARYGVVTITWVLLGYFGFLDFGLSRASANALAKLGDAGPQARSPVLVTAFTCNLLLGLAGGLVLYAVGHEVLAHFMKIPDALSRETQQSFPWMAAMLPLGMLSGVSTGALESRERFLLSNALNSFGTMAGQVVPLVCAYAIGPSLNVVIPATLLTRLFSVALAYAVVIRLEWPLRLFDVSLTWMKRLFGYGSWVTISGLLNPLLDTSNQLIVGGMLGAASVALYSVPMTLAQRAQVLATALSRTLFPKNSRDTHADAVATTRRATLSLAYGLGMVCGPAILVAAPFLHLWVAFLPYGFIQARGKPHITAIVGMVEIVPFFLVLWLLIHLLGLPGAALAWTLRVTINCVALFVLSRTLPENLWRLAPAVGLMVAALATALLVPVGGLAALGGAIVLGLVFVTCAYRLDPVLRGTVLGLGRRAGILRALGDPSQA
jgi:O-antigen/teichoic acid export membrane protein